MSIPDGRSVSRSDKASSDGSVLLSEFPRIFVAFHPEGGFHLFPYDGDYILKLAKLMKDELGVRRVAPAHCTGNLAFKIFRDLYGENYNYAVVESEVLFSH